MAVSEQTPYTEYTANGTTTSFALEFYCEKKEHLIVLVDDIEPTVGTWSLVNGAVVFETAPANGKIITIQRNTPFSRNTDYQSYNNSFRPQSVNGDFDRVWLKLQELGVTDWLLRLYIDRLHGEQKTYIDQKDTQLQNNINNLSIHVDQQDAQLQQNINNLKIYVDDKDDELRAYLMEEIRKQGVALDQLDDYYNYLMQQLAQIAVNKGWEASFVVDSSGKTQQEINNHVNALELTPEQFGNVASDATLAILRMRDRALAIAATGGKATMKFPGNYTLNAMIEFGSRINVNILGRVLQGSSFSGDSMFYVNGGTDWAEDFTINGSGLLICNDLQYGIKTDKTRFGDINDIKIYGASVSGCIVGLDLSKDASYEINSSKLKVTHASKVNSVDSIGVHWNNVTDSYITNSVVQGYCKGYRTRKGSIDIVNGHAWGGPVHGRMTHALEILGGSATITNFTSDTPYDLINTTSDLYGIYLSGYNPTVRGGRTLMNRDLIGSSTGTAVIASDNRVYPIYCDKELFGNIDGMLYAQFGDASTPRRFKSHIGGPFTSMQVSNLTDEGSSIFVDYTAKKARNRLAVIQNNEFTMQSYPLNFNASAGVTRYTQFKTDDKKRWEQGVTSGTESGINVGADIVWNRFDDAGTNKLGEVLRAKRDTGRVELLDGGLRTTGTWQKTLQIDNIHLWRDASGRFRQKDGVPTSDSDGNVIGKRVSPPATSASPGDVGQWAADGEYFYVYGGGGAIPFQWRRTALANF